MQEIVPRDSAVPPGVASRVAAYHRVVPVPGALITLALALVVRIALLTLDAGNDFRSFGRLALLTLDGRDVYGIPADYLYKQLHVLPWVYPPLCLNVFTALRDLSMQTGWSFRVLGKAPIVAADLGIGWLLYAALRRRGHSERVAIVGMCLYLFNPLVLYNGALYGRFDAIALVFLLLALEYANTPLFAPAYALAVAAKTFPIFLLPLLALGRDRQTPRRLLLAGVLTLLLSLPYIVTDPGGLYAKLVAYNTRPTHLLRLGRISWFAVPYAYHWLSAAQLLRLTTVTLALYPLVTLSVMRRPLYVKAAVCFLLFIVLNRTVYEQYLLWPLPFLIVIAVHGRSRAALGMVMLYTAAGMLENENTWPMPWAFHYHLVPTPWLPLNAALGMATALFVVMNVVQRRPWPQERLC